MSEVLKNNAGRTLVVASVLFLAGCASQLYWTRPATNVQATAADLSACRLAAPANTTFSPREIEGPCMTAKGYALNSTPPR